MLKLIQNIKHANIQDLLKSIAMISMLIDHVGLFVIPDSWLRVVGRIAMPLFAFFAGYNYFPKKKKGTKNFYNIKKYRIVLVFGIFIHLLQMSLLDSILLNILISITLGYFILDMIVNHNISNIVAIPSLILLTLILYPFLDYGALPALFMLMGYQSRYEKDLEFIISLVLSFLCLFIFTDLVMHFTWIQMIIIALIFIVTCFALLNLDLKQKISLRLCLISRYLLEFYVVHYSVLIVVCSYIYNYSY